LSYTRDELLFTRSPLALSWGVSALQITVAAAAMVATMPGRTHGLGLITEPVLADLRIGRVDYGVINLWATLLGALFCLPCGWIVDRIGIRLALTSVTVFLGAVVVLMSRVGAEPWFIPVAGAEFFILVLLTRGLGQSSLSVVSLALIGRVAGKKGQMAIAVYSVLVTIGFMAAFGLAKAALEKWGFGWRELWAMIGLIVLFGMAPLAFFGAQRKKEALDDSIEVAATGSTLGEALRTPAFWVFALATSLYGLIASGISLFNQSILAERNFDRSVFLDITILTPFVGLAGNLLTGMLAYRYGMGRLLAIAMLILAGALVAFPFVKTVPQVYLYAVTLGFSGGMVTVIFFGVWVRLYGSEHLGRIQGAAQLLTVVASAVGPLLLAQSKEHLGSYLPLFRILAGASALLALAAWFIKIKPREHVA
jgi:MFS family permease